MNKMKRYTFFLLLAILLLAALLRFWQISTNPPGLYWDEASIGYNAHSILESGTDEHGNLFPFSFKAFGEYKLPVYIYSVSISIALFGPTEFAIRLPSALAGVLSVILIYFLVLELFASRRLAFLSSFFLAVSPWHLQFSRAAFEANLALFLLVMGALLFLKSQKRPLLLLPSVLFFSLTFYTYSTARLFTPLFISFLALFWGKSFWGKAKDHKLLSFSLVLFVVSYLPLFFLPHLMTRFTSISAFNGYDIFQWPFVFLENYLSFLSFDFLFFQGDQIPRHSVKDMGNLYLFEIPLVFIGLWQLLKTRNKKGGVFLLTWLLLSPLAASFTKPSPHSLRSFPMIIPLTIASAAGLGQILGWLKIHLNPKRFLPFAYVLIAFVLIYFFFNYLHLYYVHYPKTAGLAWQEGNKEMAREVLNRAEKYDRVFISNFLGQTYIYLLFYGRIHPGYYQESLTKGGFDKYQFIGKTWPEKPKGKTLWVLSFDDKFKPEGKFLKDVKIGGGDTIYHLWETE